MNKNLHDIDKIFRDGLEDHLESAPPGVWDAVNNDLDKKQAFHFKEKYYRLKRLAVALFLLVFAGIAALFYFGTADKSKNVSLAKEQKTTVAKDSSLSPNSSVKISTDNNNKHVATTDNSTVKDPLIAKENTNPANEKNQTNGLPAEKLRNATKTQAAGNDIAPDSKTSKKNTSAVASDEKELNDNAVVADNTSKSGSKNKAKLHIAEEDFDANTANEKPVTKQLQGLNTKQLAINSRKKSSATIASESNLSSQVNNDSRYYRLKNNQQETEVSQENPTVVANVSHVSSLTAYMYQSPLLLPVIEQPVPGPFKEIDQSPFLSSIQQNDSLKKAYAIAKAKTVSRHTISIMPFAAPNHSFTRLQDNSPFAGPGRNKYAAEREERQSTSFSAGVLVNYGLTKSIIVQSGIVFSSAKTNILPKTIYARPDNNGHASYEFNCASGYSYINPKTGSQPAVGDSIKAMGASSTISYIGVPVSLVYVWQKGRFLLKPGIGVSVNFLTSGKSATSFNNAGNNQKEKASISGLKTSYADASIGFGTEVMLNRKISIGVRPLLRMALTSINKDTPVKAYQNYLSLETGIKINL